MSTQVQLRRGTAAQHATFVGAPGEVTVVTDDNTIRVHDGVTPGGHEVSDADLKQAFNAHLAEKVSQVITASRDLSLSGIQTVSTLANRKIRAIMAIGYVHTTKKMSISFTDGLNIGGLYTDGVNGDYLNGGGINFSDTGTSDRTRGEILNIQDGSFDINWMIDGNGATGTAFIRFLIFYHD